MTPQDQMAQLLNQQQMIQQQMQPQMPGAMPGMMPMPGGMQPQQGGGTVVLLPMKIETPMGRLRYYQQFEMPAGMHILNFVQQLMMQGVPVDLYQQQQNNGGGGWNRGGGGGGWNRGGGYNGGGRW